MKWLLSLLVIFLFVKNSLGQNYTAWTHSAKITINTTSTGANLPGTASLTNFPVLVRLYGGTSFDFSQAKANGEDIRFENASNVALKYQIDTWDGTSQIANIWVNIPSIQGNTSQEITVYWGNAAAASESNGAAVFDTNDGFAGVWHLNENPSNTTDGYKESTSNQSHGTGEAMEDIGPIDGVVGNSQQFVGSKLQNIIITKEQPYRFINSFTASAWILYRSNPGASFENILTKSHGAWEIGRHAENKAVYCRLQGNGHNDINGSADACDGKWHHIDVVFTGATKSIYVDGELDVTAQTNLTAGLNEKSDPVVIGYNSPVSGNRYPGRAWNGLIDEVRLSPEIRSADWIKLNFQNLKHNQTAVSIPKAAGCVDDFGITSATMDANEGQPLVIPFKALCATSLYWTNELNQPIIGDIPLLVARKRVSKDSTFKLTLNALYGTTWRTAEVTVTLKVAVAQPAFTLTAPATWDGVSSLEIKPTITNLAAIQALPTPSNKINYKWNLTHLGAARTIGATSLFLNAGYVSPLKVELCLDNLGPAVCKEVNLTVSNVTPNPTAVEKSPVKVFIMAGQSNMEGHGEAKINPLAPDAKGSLEWYVLNASSPDSFNHVMDAANGGWRVRDDVWIYYERGSTPVQGGLSVDYGVRDGKIGPEFQFGHVMGDYYPDNQVLIVKVATGGTALATAWRPPSHADYPYPPAPGDTGWHYYDMIQDVKKVTEGLKTYFSAYDDGGFEIVGMGWHQGWNDHLDPLRVVAYPDNMERLVRDVRKDLNVPGMLFVVADNGNICRPGDAGAGKYFCEQQRAIASKSEFSGTVAAVNTTNNWELEENSPGATSSHWNLNGGSYFKTGNMMGKAMTALIANTPISLFAPVGSESVLKNTTYQIQWVNNSTATNVNIELSVDGGAYQAINANAPNTGSYDWTVPDVESNNVKIKISGTSGTDTFESGVFSIIDALPIISAPDFNQVVFSIKGIHKISLPEGMRNIIIRDASGYTVKRLRINSASVYWDGLDQHNNPVKTGIYFATFSGTRSVKPVKLLLFR